MARKIPATIVTGFLGAGKTSLIRSLIAQAGARKLAFVINEFGDLGIDRELIRGCGLAECDEGSIVELANGCICCTVADDFLPTLAALLDRPEPPEHIIIETSGLALPKPLVQAFNWPSVKTRVTVDGVIAVVDGPAVASGRFAEDPARLAAQAEADPSLAHDDPLAEVFSDQLACADLVVLNKRDRMDNPAALAADLRARLRPGVKLVEAEHGSVPPAVLLGLAAAAESDLAARPSLHDNEATHDHDDFASFVLRFGAVAAPDRLVAALSDIVATHEVLRVKGFLAVPGSALRCVVQGVGDRFERYFDRPWNDGEARASALVVIGLKSIDEAAIRTALAPYLAPAA
jgi:cobalamin biosynthesis protein CobW